MSNVDANMDRPNCNIATTPLSATPQQQALAAQLATHFDAHLVPRRERSMDRLFSETGADIAILAADPVHIFDRSSTSPMFFHPSMAAQRIERIHRGERDRLLRVANIEQGDVVIDATLGLASDALVFAYAVGARGRVVGLEATQLIAQMLQAVQRFGSVAYRDAAMLLKSVEILQSQHLTWLQGQPSNSADVVYFDPMFRTPAGASASMAPFRPFALAQPLEALAVEEAKRVARRCVVVKERPLSGVFSQHGFVPDLPRRKIAYGVWHKAR